MKIAGCRASANRDFQGMGTTCSTLLLLPEGAMIAHVGDSRVYRIRNQRIDQLSFDHSLVWELVRRNHLTSEQARISVPKNVITRSLGTTDSVETDVFSCGPLDEGDIVLLCSDGLYTMVTETDIAQFGASLPPPDAVRELIRRANATGGRDNIAVAIARMARPTESPRGNDGAF